MTSEKYKEHRKALEFTQSQLADALGVTKRTIIKRESGGTITREAELAILSLPRPK